MSESVSVAQVASKQPAQSFTRKKIRVVFMLATGAFGPNGEDTVELDGYRVAATIENAEFPTAAIASVRISGLSLGLMNKLSVARFDIVQANPNQIQVYAGDDKNGMPLVFQGGITMAFADYNNAPDVAFMVQAQSALRGNATSCTPTVFKGTVRADVVLETIANKAGYSFVNHGCNDVLLNPNFPGSPGQQIALLMQKLPNVVVYINNNQLMIWPRDDPTPDDNVPYVSKDTGLVGYPSYAEGGITFRCLFNPLIVFNELVEIESKYLPTGWDNAFGSSPGNGRWLVMQVRHDLATETPGGPWFTDVMAQNLRTQAVSK